MICRTRSRINNQEDDDDDMDSDDFDALQDDDEGEVEIPLNVGRNVGSWIHQRSECSKTCGNGYFKG